MIKKVLLLVLAAALLCGCQLVALDDLAPGEETISLKASGEVYKFHFTASGDWTASIDDDSWCKITPTSGNAGEATIKISPSRNSEPENRSANIRISCLWDVKSIRVVQAAAETVLISPKEIKAPASGGTFEVKIEHNVDVDVTASEDYWYTVSTKSSGTKALQEDILVVTVQPSQYGWPREGGFTVSSSALTERVAVYQEAADVFSLSESSVEVPFSGGKFSVTLSGKTDYHISSMPEWVRELTQEGRTETFYASPNDSEAPRDGIIVFCDDGGVCLPLTVKQPGRPGWTASKFKHMSLIMRFTATWCGWCPRMNKTVKKAQELYPDKLLHLALHGNSSSLYFSPTNALMTQYLIEGYPTGIVDGRIQIDNGAINSTAQYIVSSAKETASVYGTVTGASVESSLDGNTLEMDVTVYSHQTGDYKLTLLLVENGINTAQADYEEGNHSSYIHDGVARLAVTAIGGDPFSLDDAPANQTFHYTTKLDSKWNASNVRILGYVQAKYGSRAKKRSGNYGEYYVDNCFLAVPGTTLKLELE
ncbi:MAG: Omp28-related outer membrane protein [Bacteroidales bacterium]|nr:Omp28-related outer membrane protein [Bacteroidales bacterium]